MEYYKAMKMNKLPGHTTTRLKPRSIIVRERNEIQRIHVCDSFCVRLNKK